MVSGSGRADLQLELPRSGRFTAAPLVLRCVWALQKMRDVAFAVPIIVQCV
jgi:hypothetical protein